MFDHLLELSHRGDSNKCSNIGFGEEIGLIEMKIRTLSGALIYQILVQRVKNSLRANCVDQS